MHIYLTKSYTLDIFNLVSGDAKLIIIDATAVFWIQVIEKHHFIKSPSRF